MFQLIVFFCNVKQSLLASFCNHFIGSFILEIYFQTINTNPNKIVFKPDGGQFAKSQNHSVCNSCTLPDKHCLSHGMCLYQVMMTLQFLNDVAYDAESTQKSNITP